MAKRVPSNSGKPAKRFWVGKGVEVECSKECPNPTLIKWRRAALKEALMGSARFLKIKFVGLQKSAKKVSCEASLAKTQRAIAITLCPQGPKLHLASRRDRSTEKATRADDRKYVVPTDAAALRRRVARSTAAMVQNDVTGRSMARGAGRRLAANRETDKKRAATNQQYCFMLIIPSDKIFTLVRPTPVV